MITYLSTLPASLIPCLGILWLEISYFTLHKLGFMCVVNRMIVSEWPCHRKSGYIERQTVMSILVLLSDILTIRNRRIMPALASRTCTHQLRNPNNRNNMLWDYIGNHNLKRQMLSKERSCEKKNWASCHPYYITFYSPVMQSGPVFPCATKHNVATKDQVREHWQTKDIRTGCPRGRLMKWLYDRVKHHPHMG